MKTMIELQEEYEEEVRRKRDYFIRCRERVEPLLEELKKKHGEQIIRTGFIGKIYVVASGTREDLTNLMRLFYSAGFKPTSKPKEGEKEYNTHWKHEYNEKIEVFFTFTSTQCQRVQVGEKLTPVYEYVCD